MKKIKTYEDVCKALKQAPIDFTNIPVEAHAFLKLCTIVKALNAGWMPDYSNGNQVKYEIWWHFQNNRFVFHGSSRWARYTTIGSRLCFKNSELAEYCAKQFEDLWNEYLRYV